MKNDRRRGKSVQTGQRFRVEIVGMAPGGWGIARRAGRQVLVRHGLPGDRLEVRIARRERGRIEAVIERILDRKIPVQDAACGHAGVCGGCLWQHVPYETQLDLKYRIVQYCFARAGLDVQKIAPALASPDVFAYRNKVDFTFGRRRDGVSGLGLFEAGIRARGAVPPVFDVVHCGLTTSDGNRIVETVRRAMAPDLPVYDAVQREGVLRSLVIREGLQTGEILVQFVASENCREMLKPVADAIVHAVSAVRSVVLSVNPKRSKNAVPQEEMVLAGRDAICERIGGLQIRVSPTSFLQVNTRQAEHLYAQASAFAALAQEDEALDLYCGAGTLSLLLARHAHRVTGVEMNASAIADAEENARQNDIHNVRFFCGDVLSAVPELTADGYAPDVVTVNPPRSGVFRAVVDRICALQPRRIVYVSCNPETLSRDLVRFRSGGYAVLHVQPVDMFPHTPHIEVVTCLVKGSSVA